MSAAPTTEDSSALHRPVYFPAWASLATLHELTDWRARLLPCLQMRAGLQLKPWSQLRMRLMTRSLASPPLTLCAGRRWHLQRFGVGHRVRFFAGCSPICFGRCTRVAAGRCARVKSRTQFITWGRIGARAGPRGRTCRRHQSKRKPWPSALVAPLRCGSFSICRRRDEQQL